uniref:Uncharacterized protein n=1 Tax=Ciona intestinalis TaxID=7719 RepID=H2XUN9_CIOIN
MCLELHSQLFNALLPFVFHLNLVCCMNLCYKIEVLECSIET